MSKVCTISHSNEELSEKFFSVSHLETDTSKLHLPSLPGIIWVFEIGPSKVKI